MLGSITTLVDLALQSSHYLKEVEDAPKTRVRLIEEVESVRVLLKLIKGFIEKPEPPGGWPGGLNALNVPSGPLGQIKLSLEKLNGLLKSTVGAKDFGKGIKGLGRRMTFPWNSEEIQGIIDNINRQKSTILLALESDNVSVPPPNCNF